MKTPVCDFVKKYAEENSVRLHMPGHKGKAFLGPEKFDITEIDGADELFCAEGIIKESEENASTLFSSKTFYSAGGSTLCIQAMLHLLSLYAHSKGETPRLLAARNAHKAFVNAAALLDIEIEWLYPKEKASYHSCPVTADEVDAALKIGGFTAVYLTSPDYLGNLQDIEGISEVCKRNGVLLAVDNAHGAYLKFLPKSLHPIDLGADICCDSAHKTLPVLTGGAYLHLGRTAPKLFFERAKSSIFLFGSSSPSYLILQSLDNANALLEEFKEKLAAFIPQAKKLKAQIGARGFEICGDEILKLTIKPKSFGYNGTELAQKLMRSKIFPEFYDPDFVVLMLSPYNSKEELERLRLSLCSLSKRAPVLSAAPPLPRPEKVLSPREAIFKSSAVLPAEKCLGKVCAQSAISCPPAILLVVCGEKIDKAALESFRYYGIDTCTVVV